MKKKFLVIVCLILSLIMSFALISCGDDSSVSGGGGGGGGDNDSQTTTKQQAIAGMLTSVDAMADAESFQGSASVTLTLPSTAVYAVEFDLRDTQAMYTLSSEENGKTTSESGMFDVATGYAYSKTSEGWVVDQQFYPQGTVEYVLESVKQIAVKNGVTVEPDDMTADDIAQLADVLTYDATANTLSASVDYAADINAALAPLQKVYADDGNIEDLIDAYLAVLFPPQGQSMPVTARALAAGFATVIGGSADSTIPEFVNGFAAMGGATQPVLTQADYEAFLKQIGITAAADLTEAKTRTVGEAVNGLIKFVKDKVNLTDIDALKALVKSLATDDAAAKALLGELVKYVFVMPIPAADATPEKLTATLNSIFDTALDLAASFDVRDVIDSIGLSAKGSAKVAYDVVKTIIAEGVKFEKLGATFTIGLDSKTNAFKTFKVDFGVKHNYKKDSDLPLLSGSEYKGSALLTVDSYSQVATPFDMTFKTDPQQSTRILSLVCLADTDDVEVYFETRPFGAKVTVSDIRVLYYDPGKGSAMELATNAVTFDDKDSEFDIGRKMFASIPQASQPYGVQVTATVDYGATEKASVSVNIMMIADHSEKTIATLAKDYFDRFVGAAA